MGEMTFLSFVVESMLWERTFINLNGSYDFECLGICNTEPGTKWFLYIILSDGSCLIVVTILIIGMCQMASNSGLIIRNVYVFVGLWVSYARWLLGVTYHVFWYS